jgi:tetratricopeptide (TPR) repeat protein
MALLLAVVALVYGRSLEHGFVLLDDDRNVYANPLVHPSSPSSDRRFERAWREPYLSLYIPVTYSLWALVADAAWSDPSQADGEVDPRVVAGLAPRPFHALNVALHALAALLVFAILRGALGSDAAALFGAAFFALHPLQAEPVAWVSGLKDLAGGCLALASVWLYTVHARPDGRDVRGGRGMLAWALALVAFALGFLAKPSAVVVPLLAGILDVGLFARPWRRVAASLWPFALLGIAGIAATALVQPPDPDVPAVALWQRPGIAADALGFYAAKLVAPFDLAPLYDKRPDTVLAGGRWWIGALVVAALSAAALAARRRSSVPLAALGLFAAGLAPVLGFVPFTFQVQSTVADRYAYLALLGPALLAGWLVRGRPGAIALGGLVLAVLGARAADQVELWETSEGLFVHALAVNPSSSFAHTNLGEIYAREGNTAGALEHFEEAVRLAPGSARTQNNLGTYLGQNGRLEEGLGHLAEAVRLDPQYAPARMNLASTLIGLGRYREAIAELQAVHGIEPDFARAYLSRGVLHGALGEPREAALAFQEALRADPELVDARVQLGSVYLQSGQIQEALMTLRAAVGQAPEHALAHAELGRALLAAERPAEALAPLEQALRLDPSLEHLRPMLDQARRGARTP